jgi:hypothetical protein
MLSLALQRQLTDLEMAVATQYRAVVAGDELLLVDGPLRGRTHLPRAVGYVKTHHTAYLSGPHAAVVTALQPGQRTPIFLMGTSWSRHAWYLRLPSRSTAPWAGVARCEASLDLPPEQITTLADVTALLLPPLAGVDYKDPRAPQNLIPIGGLEAPPPPTRRRPPALPRATRRRHAHRRDVSASPKSGTPQPVRGHRGRGRVGVRVRPASTGRNLRRHARRLPEVPDPAYPVRVRVIGGFDPAAAAPSMRRLLRWRVGSRSGSYAR